MSRKTVGHISKRPRMNEADDGGSARIVSGEDAGLLVKEVVVGMSQATNIPEMARLLRQSILKRRFPTRFDEPIGMLAMISSKRHAKREWIGWATGVLDSWLKCGVDDKLNVVDRRMIGMLNTDQVRSRTWALMKSNVDCMLMANDCRRLLELEFNLIKLCSIPDVSMPIHERRMSQHVRRAVADAVLSISARSRNHLAVRFIEALPHPLKMDMFRNNAELAVLLGTCSSFELNALVTPRILHLLSASTNHDDAWIALASFPQWVYAGVWSCMCDLSPKKYLHCNDLLAIAIFYHCGEMDRSTADGLAAAFARVKSLVASIDGRTRFKNGVFEQRITDALSNLDVNYARIILPYILPLIHYSLRACPSRWTVWNSLWNSALLRTDRRPFGIMAISLDMVTNTNAWHKFALWWIRGDPTIQFRYLKQAQVRSVESIVLCCQTCLENVANHSDDETMRLSLKSVMEKSSEWLREYRLDAI